LELGLGPEPGVTLCGCAAALTLGYDLRRLQRQGIETSLSGGLLRIVKLDASRVIAESPCQPLAKHQAGSQQP
jgi:hypothetical protein